MIASLANVVSYVCFSILVGYFFLHLVRDDRRPSVHVPTWLVRGATIAVPFLFLVPVIRLITTLYFQFNVSISDALVTVLLEYASGQAWLLSVVLAALLLSMRSLPLTRGRSGIALVTVLLLIVIASWSSHGAAVAGWLGFVGNTLHLLAVSTWIGVLLIVAWFTKEWKEPLLFYRWFSLVAVGAVAVIIVSGLMLMSAIVPEYVQSWLLSYGHLLFIKHLLFLPLLAFGAHHFLLGIRKGQNKPVSNVLRSFRFESLIALVIFAISAVMTEQTPPHEVAQTLQTEVVSKVMRWFIGEDQLAIAAIQLAPSWLGWLLLLTALLFFTIAWVLLVRTHSFRMVLLCFLLSILTGYSAVMTSVALSTATEDETIYETIEEAVSQSYHESVKVEILVTEQVEEEWHVVYTVDQQDLVAEKVSQVEEGFKRLPAAMLTIGGTAVVDEEQKIRTFRVQSGNWHDDIFSFTYVTFGMIKEPADIARVQIHYEGGSYIAEVENHSFINVVSSQDQWADQHPIDFLAEDGRVIDTYSRNVMEEGVYCH